MIACPECKCKKIIKMGNVTYGEVYETKNGKFIRTESDLSSEDDFVYICQRCNYQSEDSYEFGDSEI